MIKQEQPILNDQKEGIPINNSFYQNPSAMDLEKQESQSQLNESVDLLINKSESKQQQQFLLKSYLNDEPKQEPADINIVASALNKVQEMINNLHQQEKQKSSFKLFYETVSCSLLSFSFLYLFSNANKELKGINQQVKDIQTNITKVKQNPHQYMVGNYDFLVYGKINPKNTVANWKDQYKMYEINVKSLVGYNQNYTQISNLYEFPVLKNQKIMNEASIIPSSKNKTLLANLLLAPIIKQTISIGSDSSNQSDIINGEGVFIVGKKLANNAILPQAIFRKFNFQYFDQLKTVLKAQKVLFGVCGGVILAVSLYKLYTLLKREIENNDVSVESVLQSDKQQTSIKLRNRKGEDITINFKTK